MKALTVVKNQANLAAEINLEHTLAHQAAETAVQHAVRCGELLLSVKASLAHGEFRRWVEENCDFAWSTGKCYMAGARQKANGLAFSSVRGIFPSGKIKKTDTKVRQTEDHDYVVVSRHAEHHVEHTGPNSEVPIESASAKAVRTRQGREAIMRFNFYLPAIGELHDFVTYRERDANPKTQQAFDHSRELEVLLSAWQGASRHARERFVASKSNEIAGALPVCVNERRKREKRNDAA